MKGKKIAVFLIIGIILWSGLGVRVVYFQLNNKKEEVHLPYERIPSPITITNYTNNENGACNETMKFYQFQYQNDSENDKQPENTHLVFETSDGLLYLVDSSDNTKVYGSDDKGVTWTQIDVDPSNTSGDNKSRDHDIQAAWHDRDNEIIYFGDGNNNGALNDDFDIWTLDYSGGFGSESATEVGTESTYANYYIHDIFRYDGSTYALISYRHSSVYSTRIYDVSSSPFSSQKEIESEFNRKTYPVILNGTSIYSILYENFYYSQMTYESNYFYVVDTTINRVYKLDSDLDYIATYNLDSSNSNPSGIVSDGTYFYVGNSDDTVYKYNSSFVLQTSYDLSGDLSYGGVSLAFDGTYIYVQEGNPGADNIYKYNTSFTLQDTFTLDSDNTNAFDMCWDGTYFYVPSFVGGSDCKVYKYNNAWVLQDSYTLDSNNSLPYGIAYNGTNIYIKDIGSDDESLFYIYNTSFTLQDTKTIGKRLNFMEYDFNTDVVDTVAITIGITSKIPSDNYRYLAFDNSDTLYYTLQKVSDPNYYLQSYVISTSTNTELSQFDVALMLDRNNVGTTPNKQEKGFEIGGTKIYEIPSAYSGRLNHLQDIQNNQSKFGGTDESTIIAITDNFMFVDNDGTIEVWEYTDASNYLTEVVTDYNIQEPAKARTNTTLFFATNQSIKLYDDLLTLIFQGLVYSKHNEDNLIEYIFRPLSYSHLESEVSVDYSSVATEAATIAQAVIDNDDYLYYDATSIPTTSITIKIKYDDQSIEKILDDLADRIDGLWFIEPDGRIWLIQATGLTEEAVEYYGTYDFNHDSVDSEPDNWTSNNGSSCTTTIILEKDGIKKVLELDDQNGSGICQIYRSITQSADQTLEFYIGKDSVGANTVVYLELYEDATRIIRIRLDEDDIDNYASASWSSIDDTVITANTLHHVKIELDDTANTYDISLDGTSIGTSVAYENNSTTSINKIQLLTDSADTGYKGYFAALGISSDSNYDIGDNLDGLSDKTKGLSSPIIDQVQAQINYVKIYGGFVSGSRITSEAEDEAAQQLHGIIEWVGTTMYPYITDQTQLDNLAQAILDRSGTQDYPKTISFEYWSVGNDQVNYLQVGNTFRLTFSIFTELQSYEDYIIQRVRYDAKGDQALLTLSNGLLQKQDSKDYQQDQQIKANTQMIDDTASDTATNASDIASLGGTLVWLTDDPSSPHIDETDLNNNNWEEFDLDDLSITIPDGATGIIATVQAADSDASGANSWFMVRPKGYSNNFQACKIAIRADGFGGSRLDISGVIIVPIDAGHIFEYSVSPSVDQVAFTIIAWVI